MNKRQGIFLLILLYIIIAMGLSVWRSMLGVYMLLAPTMLGVIFVIVIMLHWTYKELED